MDKKPSKKSHTNALRLFREGVKYGCSTDVSGKTSYGYGELDNYGFWEYPLYFDVEPSPAKEKCPDCNGTGINPEKFPDARCPCTQPEPMPLRQQFEDACMYYGCCPYDALLDRLEVIAIARDQQVRKAVIEEVCKLLDDELRIISPNTEAKLKAHLRAMAGGER
jgi:hypothetical protein